MQAPERKSTRLRGLINKRYSEGRAILVPSAHDCVSAKLIEQAGFEHLNVAGTAPTAVWTGEPEYGVVTMTEMAFAAYRILGCVNVPGKAAVNQGGNALNLIRAFREFERAGAAMIQMEDQPGAHHGGYVPGKQIITVQEMVRKIHAARYAREDPDVIIAVRTDAKLAVGGGYGEMIRRCKIYADAGAEALMPHGMETMEEWEKAGRELRSTGLPLLASLSAGLLFTPKDQARRPLPTVKHLEEMGWTLLTYANHLLHIQMTAARDYLRQLISDPDGISPLIENIMDTGERYAILGLPVWKALEEVFVEGGHAEVNNAKVRPEDTYVYRTLDDARAHVRRVMARKGIVPGEIEAK